MSKKQLKAVNPLIYERTSTGEAIYDIYSRLLKDRILMLSDEVNSESASNMISQLLWLDKQSDKPIQLYISSPGGSVSEMFAMHDIMQHIKAPVYTVVIGLAASAAAILLAAGEKGHRYALPYSEILIHQPFCEYAGGGTTTDVEIQTRWMSNTKKRMLEILARHTGNTYSKVEKACERDCWLLPEQAIEFGIIDKIITPNKPLPPLKTYNKKTKKS